eukprot:1512297-Pleurochrysis_carterae.AAC.5
MNETLKKFGQGWRFAETTKKRDQRPQGNDARALLTRNGLLAELLTKVYGEVSTPEQAEAMRHMNSSTQSATSLRSAPIGRPEVSRPQARTAKKKKRDTISFGGFTSSTNASRNGSNGTAGLPANSRLHSSSQCAAGPAEPAAGTTSATAAPTSTASPTADGRGIDDHDDNADDDFAEEEEFLPEMGAFATTGGLESALHVWQTCIELNEQLHSVYDDRSSLELRAKAAVLNEKKGKACWAMAIRNHTGVFAACMQHRLKQLHALVVRALARAHHAPRHVLEGRRRDTGARQQDDGAH